MCKWYYLCTYSFDPDITVVGPFDSDVECFQAAGRDASKEYNTYVIMELFWRHSMKYTYTPKGRLRVYHFIRE